MSSLLSNRLYLAALLSVLGVFMIVLFVPISHAQDQGSCEGSGYEWYSDAYGGTCGDSGNSGSPVVLTMTANPSTIAQGQSSTLSWGWDRALANPGSFSCSIDHGVGAVEVIGSRVVTPPSSTLYTIICTYTYIVGVNTVATMDFSSAANVYVTPAASPITATLTASPTSVTSGGSATLTWSSTNAVSCTGTNFSTAGATSGSVSTGPLSATTNYSVTCVSSSGTAATSATWKYRESDISDFACPLTDPNRAYGGLPNCPANPEGKTCNANTSTLCKKNTINGCNMYTDIYECTGTTGTPPQSATAYTTVTVTAPPATGQANLTVDALGNTTATAGTPKTFTTTIRNLSATPATPSWSVSDYAVADKYSCTNVAIGSATKIYTSGVYFDDGEGGGDIPYYEELDGAPGICAASGSACCTVRERFRNPKGTGPADDDLYMSFEVFGGSPAGVVSAPDQPYSGTSGTATAFMAINRVSSTQPTVIPNIIQVDNNADHSTVTQTFAANTVSSVAANGTASLTGSYTFPTGGTYPQTWYVRSCTDNSTSFVGVVPESNEADNCSPWATVTVGDPTGGGVTACTVSPSTIVAGSSVTWSATPTNVGPYTWAPSEGGAPGGTAATLSRSYATAGTYGMSVTAGGVTRACPNVTVTPATPVCGTANPTITANPDRVNAGSTSTLTVSASGVDTTCTITGPGVTQTLTATSCNVPSTTITTGQISTQSTFTISCDNGEKTDQVVVNVIPNFDEF